MECGKYFPEKIIYATKGNGDGSIVHPLPLFLPQNDLISYKRRNNLYYDKIVDNKLLSNLRLSQFNYDNTALVKSEDNKQSFVIHNKQILQSLVLTGAKPGGILPGEFVYYYHFKTLNLTQINSPLFLELQEKQKIQALNKVNPKLFTIGDVFISKGNNVYVYLGVGSSKRIAFEVDYKSPDAIQRFQSYDLPTAHIFAKFEKNTTIEQIENTFKDKKALLKHITLIKSTNCVKQIGNIKVDDDIIIELRYVIEEQTRALICEPKKFMSFIHKYDLILYMNRYSDNSPPCNLLNLLLFL